VRSERQAQAWLEVSPREAEITSSELVAWAERKADDTGDDRYLAVTEEFLRESAEERTKTVKATYRVSYRVSEAARNALEQERHGRRMAGKRAGSDLSSLVDAAILKAYGKRGAK